MISFVERKKERVHSAGVFVLIMHILNRETCLGKIIASAVHEEKEKKPKQNWHKIFKRQTLDLFHIEKKPRASLNSFIEKTFSIVKPYVGRLS